MLYHEDETLNYCSSNKSEGILEKKIEEEWRNYGKKNWYFLCWYRYEVEEERKWWRVKKLCA